MTKFKDGATPQDLYNMGLFENKVFQTERQYGGVDYTMVKRVPGGWIIHSRDGEDVLCSFVPFNNEFQLI